MSEVTQVAQVTQVTLDRNTDNNIRSKVKKTPPRSRVWCCTLNTYTPDDIKNLSSLPKCEYTFQEEKGENGNLHLQGVFKFKDGKSLITMKKINNKAHWEICKNYNASLNYCTKEDTRIGEIFTNNNKIKPTKKELTEIEIRELGKKWFIEDLNKDPWWKELLKSTPDMFDKHKYITTD